MANILSKVGQSFNVPVHIYEADTEEDMNTIDMQGVPMGSKCHIINNGKWYMLNSKGEWKIMPSGGGGASWVTISETLPNAMYRLGDVKMDGSLTQDDGLEIMNYGAGDVDFSSVQKVLSDVDFNREIDYIDTSLIMSIINGTYTPTFGWATAVEYASAKVGDDVKAVFRIKSNDVTIDAPTYCRVPWDGIIAIYSNAEIPAGTTGLIQILK